MGRVCASVFHRFIGSLLSTPALASQLLCSHLPPSRAAVWKMLLLLGSARLWQCIEVNKYWYMFYKRAQSGAVVPARRGTLQTLRWHSNFVRFGSHPVYVCTFLLVERSPRPILQLGLCGDPKPSTVRSYCCPIEWSRYFWRTSLSTSVWFMTGPRTVSRRLLIRNNNKHPEWAINRPVQVYYYILHPKRYCNIIAK